MSAIVGLKRGFAWGLDRAGLPRLLRSLQRGRAAILMYHRVNDSCDPFFPALPSKVFEQQVDFLRRSYRVEPLEDVVKWLRSGAPGPPRAAVTIDDGYRDTYEVVFPFLRARAVPATLFLSTGPVETGVPLWLDHLRGLLKRTPARVFECRALGMEARRIDTVAERLEVLEGLRALLKRSNRRTVDAAIGELADRLGAGGSVPLPKSLTWAEVAEMAGQGIQIGAHTHKHYVLSNLDREEARAEIAQSILLIEGRLHAPVRTFAYPNGGPTDYTPVTKALVSELGLLAACSTRHGFVRPGADPFELPRLETSERSLPMFACHMAGITRKRPDKARPTALRPEPLRVARVG
jgi:peptidoglycan/xylan/chitin deacetylase (PgdA/CDA1 family)